MAPQEYPQPFTNRPETFAYIPRRNGDTSPQAMHAQFQQPRPLQPQVFYYPPPQPYFMPHAYAVHQQPVYHPVAPGAAPAGLYYYPQPQYYPCYPGYGPQAAAHAAQPSQQAPAPAPAQPGPLRLADGRLPYYGRTQQEVTEDAIEVARAHDKKELHTFAPAAEPSTKFWCKMPDTGEYKMLPLGTINLTWKGDWRHDPIHDRVYFVATELK